MIWVIVGLSGACFVLGYCIGWRHAYEQIMGGMPKELWDKFIGGSDG
jgi:hypothetical protein